MLKIGEVSLDTSAQHYNIIWYLDKLSNERIDVVEDINKYSNVDTTNCIASYIKGKSEKCYGDRSIISKILKIKC